MNSEEATRVFQSLTTMLKDVGLGWLAEQVSHEVLSGKEISKRVSVESEEFTPTGRPRRQRTAFVSTVPYSANEQLFLLVNAIEHSVVGIAEMENFLLEFASQNARLVGVKFVPEAVGADGFSFSHSDSEPRLVATKQLQNLCNELRRELERAD